MSSSVALTVGRTPCGCVVLYQKQMLSKETSGRSASPTPTVVVSRFFNKGVDLPSNARVDAPPKPSRPTSARGRSRTTRAVGQRDTIPESSSDMISVELLPFEQELISMLEEQKACEQREQAVSPSLKAPVPLTKEQQFACYLGNCAPLMMYARERYGEAGVGGITTRQVRAWLKANPDFVPEHLRGVEFHIDHIIGDGVGGQSWPLNYFIMPKAANLWFGGWLTLEKRRYVGMHAWTAATCFTMWCAQKSRATLPFGNFDPVEDKFLSKRTR